MCTPVTVTLTLQLYEPALCTKIKQFAGPHRSQSGHSPAARAPRTLHVRPRARGNLGLKAKPKAAIFKQTPSRTGGRRRLCRSARCRLGLGYRALAVVARALLPLTATASLTHAVRLQRGRWRPSGGRKERVLARVAHDLVRVKGLGLGLGLGLGSGLGLGLGLE